MSLFDAITEGNLSAVQDLLYIKGVLAADRNTVLDLDKAQKLLQIEHYTLAQKSNALHLAARQGHEELAMWIVDTFPSLDLLAATDICGDTPAFYAGYHGHLGLLQKLLREAGFLDNEYFLVPGKSLELKKHLGGSGLSAFSGSLELGHLDTALWLLSLLNFNEFSCYSQNMFQYAILKNQFPTFEGVAQAAGILDQFGIAFDSKTIHTKILPTDWVKNARVAFATIPTTLIDALMKAGVCISAIHRALTGTRGSWYHQGRTVSAVAAQSRASVLVNAYYCEDAYRLPLSANMNGRSLLTKLIKSRAIDKINFRLEQGDVLPLPPRMETVTLPVETKNTVKEKEMLLLNCHLIYHAQRILHTLKENPLNSALLQKHLEPMISLQSLWPDLDGARCLPALKALILAIHEQIQSTQSEDLSDLMLQALLTWPRSQPASDRSPLTAVKPPQFTLSYHHYAPEEPLGAGAAAAGATATKPKPTA